jgi:hypothetical protein
MTDLGSWDRKISTRTKRRIDDIARLGKQLDELIVANADLGEFVVLAAEYDACGLHHLPGPLREKIGVARVVSLRVSVPDDADVRILRYLDERPHSNRIDIAGDLGGISESTLRPILQNLIDRWLVKGSKARYSLTELGRDVLSKSDEPTDAILK